jgi:hypothetical protein
MYRGWGALCGEEAGMGCSLLFSVTICFLGGSNIPLPCDDSGVGHTRVYACICVLPECSALEIEEFQDFSLFRYKKLQYVSCTSVSNI